MAIHRSKTNYAQVYGSDKQGYNLGLDGAIYLKRETTRGVFVPPSIGTQGKSLGAVSASTDITAHATPATLNVAVNGGAVVTASLAVAGLNTGALIAAALQTAINAALAAGGQDHRVWVAFDGAAPDRYTVWSQSTGDTSTVVITAGATNNIADDLNLGVGEGGTETAGTDDTDFLLYTTGGINASQPVESNAHRSGRFHTGIIRKKKVVEFDFDTYINMSGAAGASIDDAVALLIEAFLGKKTVGGSFIDFEQDLPVVYMSMVRVSTIFAEYFTGGYVKTMVMTGAGDGPATVKYTGKAAEAFEAGIAKVTAAATTATPTLVADEAKRFTPSARVVSVGADGRSIIAGADGSISVDAVNVQTNTVTLSTAVPFELNGFLVFWDPGAVQQTGRDAIFTDLVGSAKLNAGSAAVDVTSWELSMDNGHVDFDNRFGADANKGFAAGNRMTAGLTIGFDLSNETYGDIVQSKQFAGFSPEIVLGSVASGRYLKITAPKWIPEVPVKEVPENGVTPIQLKGNLYQSAPGAKDPVKFRFG